MIFFFFWKDEIIGRETKLSTLKWKVVHVAMIEGSYTLSHKFYAGKRPLYANTVQKQTDRSILDNKKMHA